MKIIEGVNRNNEKKNNVGECAVDQEGVNPIIIAILEIIEKRKS